MDWSWTDNEMVQCLACGGHVPREDAREYDRFGDRWERTGKEFEYLCKPCFTAECHLPRTKLEAMLLEIDNDVRTPEEFIRAYYRVIAGDDDRPDE